MPFIRSTSPSQIAIFLRVLTDPVTVDTADAGAAERAFEAFVTRKIPVEVCGFRIDFGAIAQSHHSAKEKGKKVIDLIASHIGHR